MVRAGSFRKAKSLTARGSGRSMRMATRSPGFGAKTVVSRRVRLNGGKDNLSIVQHFLAPNPNHNPKLAPNLYQPMKNGEIRSGSADTIRLAGQSGRRTMP